MTQSASEAMTGALQYLAEAFSVSRQEFQMAVGVQLMEGVLAHGYANEHDGRYAISAAGRRRLDHADHQDEPERESEEDQARAHTITI